MFIRVETSIAFDAQTELKEARRFEEEHRDWVKHESTISVIFTKIEQFFTARGEEDDNSDM